MQRLKKSMFQTHRIVHPPKIKTLTFLFIATLGIASAAQSDAPASSKREKTSSATR